MNWKQYHDDLMQDVETRIADRLKRYRPDLSLATGNLSTTQYPTPTGNAPGGYTPSAHTHPWSDITSTPTTLSGYGITDAQPLDGDLTAIAALSTVSFGRGLLELGSGAAVRAYIGAGTGSGSVTSVDITQPAAGITATGGPITTSGAITLALANDLAALEGLSGTGLAARTATDTWAQRTITGTASRISVTNGSGAAGNPTIDIDAAYVGQASLTTLGTIGAGVWQGTKVAEAYGGTNQSAYTRGDLLYASAANTLSKLAIGTAAHYLRTDGTDPSWHTLDAADLAYSGLTTGQVLRSTGATSAAFGALDLANSSAVTGILAAANGGTGVNNGSNNLTVPATGTAALLATANAFTAAQSITVSDAATTTTTTIATLGHNSSGTPAASFGARLLFRLKDSTTNDQDAAAVDAIWTTATHASQNSALLFLTANAGGSPVEAMRLTNTGALWVGLTSGGVTGRGLSVKEDSQFNASLTVSTGLNVGTASGASTGEIRTVRNDGSYQLKIERTSATARAWGLAVNSAGTFLLDDITAPINRLSIDTSGIVTITGEVRTSDMLRLNGSTSQSIQMKVISSLANNGTAQFGIGTTDFAWAFITSDSGALAIFTTQSTLHTTQEISDPNAVFSITAGTGSSNNIYWSAGNSRYEIENKTGVTRTYRIFFIMSS